MEELSAAATGFLWDSGGGEAAAAGRFIGGGTLAGDRRQKEDQARAVTHATRVGEGEGKGKKKMQPCDTGWDLPLGACFRGQRERQSDNGAVCSRSPSAAHGHQPLTII